MLPTEKEKLKQIREEVLELGQSTLVMNQTILEALKDCKPCRLKELEKLPKKERYNKIDEIDEVGFRTKGNTTRVIPFSSKSNKYHRAHFKIKFNE